MDNIVEIIIASTSDEPKVQEALSILQQFNVRYIVTFASAHRTPDLVMERAKSARDRGVRVIIAAAGSAAHLAGAIAANTTLPVIGLPLSVNSLNGLDALLSTVQMPSGVPVATVAIDGAHNAALLAIEILALIDISLEDKLINYRESLITRLTTNNLDL